MNEHVLDWLSAYHDEELHGDRLRAVEAHLTTCAHCQAELQALRGLSATLQAGPPWPARTPPEQFVAQVRLRLPHRAPPMSERARLRRAAGLWLPLSALMVWALGQAVLAAGGLVSLVWWGASGQPPFDVIDVLILDVVLTAIVAGMVWGGLAGWWAAREREPSVPGGPASRPVE